MPDNLGLISRHDSKLVNLQAFRHPSKSRAEVSLDPTLGPDPWATMDRRTRRLVIAWLAGAMLAYAGIAALWCFA